MSASETLLTGGWANQFTVPVTALHNCKVLALCVGGGRSKRRLMMHHEDLNERKLLSFLSYEENVSGPRQMPTWTIQCKSRYPFFSAVLISWLLLTWRHFPFLQQSVNGVVKGVGIGQYRRVAKQEAAKQALEVSSAISDDQREAPPNVSNIVIETHCHRPCGMNRTDLSLVFHPTWAMELKAMT